MKEKLGFYTKLNFCIYTPTILEETIKVDVKFENTMYNLELIQAGILDANRDREGMMLVSRLFKTIQSKLKLMRIGKKFFDPSQSVKIKEYDIEIWPGYNISLNQY